MLNGPTVPGLVKGLNTVMRGLAFADVNRDINAGQA
jgi:hypothetical protein